VFRDNRNKQKTNRNSSKFVKISTLLIPHTISSVCFGCFDTGLKHRNKPKQIKGFADNLIENVFRRFFGLFRFVSRKFCLFRLFRYWSETPKQPKQTEKNVFSFEKQTEKQSKQIEFRFVSVRTEKKFIVSRTPYPRSRARPKI
jgi:hypothetical protein